MGHGVVLAVVDGVGALILPTGLEVVTQTQNSGEHRTVVNTEQW